MAQLRLGTKIGPYTAWHEGNLSFTVIPVNINKNAWQGSSAPFTNTVSVPWINANDKAIIDVDMSDVDATVEQIEEAWSKIYWADTAPSAVVFRAKEKPTVDIPVQILVMRW